MSSDEKALASGKEHDPSESTGRLVVDEVSKANEKKIKIGGIEKKNELKMSFYLFCLLFCFSCLTNFLTFSFVCSANFLTLQMPDIK